VVCGEKLHVSGTFKNQKLVRMEKEAVELDLSQIHRLNSKLPSPFGQLTEHKKHVTLFHPLCSIVPILQLFDVTYEYTLMEKFESRTDLRHQKIP
jgi:hypothetical protein